MNSNKIQAVIFDLGDVLFTWSISIPDFPLPPKTLKCMLGSITWFEYEKGNRTEEQAYTDLANEFGCSFEDVRSAFQMARTSLGADPMMWDLVRQLKKSGVRLYAMSNISAPEWEVLRGAVSLEDWEAFDHVFTSYVFIFI